MTRRELRRLRELEAAAQARPEDPPLSELESASLDSALLDSAGLDSAAEESAGRDSAEPDMNQQDSIPGEPPPFEPRPVEPPPGEPHPFEPRPAEPKPGGPSPGEPPPAEPNPFEPGPAVPNPGGPSPGEPPPAEPHPFEPPFGSPPVEPLPPESHPALPERAPEISMSDPDISEPETDPSAERESESSAADAQGAVDPAPLPAPMPHPAVPFIEQPAGFVRPVEEVTGLRGFRGWLHRISGGAVFGPSAEERFEAELDRRIRRGIGGSQNTAFLSLKGGVGKTSTTIGVGLTLAGIREGSVCAIDANPDAGDLIERALGEGAYESERELTITRLLQEIGGNESRRALDSYLHEASRLRLLAGEQDPELSDSLTAEDYRRVYHLVSRHYGVTLTDCGTGVSRPAMRGILENADNVVVAAGFAVSGAKRARDTLAWLASHGFGGLARNAIVVVTDKDGVSARVDKAAIEETLGGMCRVLISVPHDNAIADGDLISLASLRPDTRRAYREIAAAIVDGFR